MKRDGAPNKFFIPADQIETKVVETEIIYSGPFIGNIRDTKSF